MRRVCSTMLAIVALAAGTACRSVQRAVGASGAPGEDRSTSIYGHWVLATPIDSTAFTGASQVELVLAPGSFSLSASYPGRPSLAIDGRAELADGRTLTLVPASSSSGGLVGLTPGRPFTRLASASGATLVLAPPASSVPVPSSVWYRLDAARLAGVAR